MLRCNLCAGDAFEVVGERGAVRCARCGSLERTRVAGLLVDAALDLAPGAHILHFAPERGLAHKLQLIGSENYRAVDIAPERYPGLDVARFDLCKDVFGLRAGAYDLIVHNHVLEHIECNHVVVLIRLLQALTPTGAMLFSVPIVDDCFSDTLSEDSLTEKRARFGTALHVRQFGRAFLQETLGMIFDLPVAYDLTAVVSPATLMQANIGRRHWSKWTGASVFCVRRGDLRV